MLTRVCSVRARLRPKILPGCTHEWVLTHSTAKHSLRFPPDEVKTKRSQWGMQILAASLEDGFAR